MSDRFRIFLEQTGPVTASAPCRIDMGGTLDIKTIFLPLRHLSPSTFNLALDLRTTVTVSPYTRNRIRVSSRGFDRVDFPCGRAAFDHPLGLMFAIPAFFNASGIQVDIDSSSPPRSALGGSSAAAVALIAALAGASDTVGQISKENLVITAHALEESVARVPCGLQDQLAAAYGGVHAWHWQPVPGNPLQFARQPLFVDGRENELEACFLVAYCGIPHESKDINSQWLAHFLQAREPDIWQRIVASTNGFIAALEKNDIEQAVAMMDAEVDERQKMTPGVFDDMGLKLVIAARKNGCGARFTGAGGGGCVWALGTPDRILRLKAHWQEILATHEQACLLNTTIDPEGVKRH